MRSSSGDGEYRERIRELEREKMEIIEEMENRGLVIEQ